MGPAPPSIRHKLNCLVFVFDVSPIQYRSRVSHELLLNGGSNVMNFVVTLRLLELHRGRMVLDRL